MKEKVSARNNSPSPTSYKSFESWNNTNTQYNRPVTNKISKSEKRSFVDQALLKSKKVPGVGKYDAHIALDKVARPMKSRM